MGVEGRRRALPFSLSGWAQSWGFQLASGISGRKRAARKGSSARLGFPPEAPAVAGGRPGTRGPGLGWSPRRQHAQCGRRRSTVASAAATATGAAAAALPLSLPVPTSEIQVRVTASPPLALSLQAALPAGLWLRARRGQRAGVWRGPRAAAPALPPPPPRAPWPGSLPAHPAGASPAARSAPRSSACRAARLWKQELEGKNLASL